MRTSIKAVDKEIALAYVASKPGFNIEVEDGRLALTARGRMPALQSVDGLSKRHWAVPTKCLT